MGDNVLSCLSLKFTWRKHEYFLSCLEHGLVVHCSLLWPKFILQQQTLTSDFFPPGKAFFPHLFHRWKKNKELRKIMLGKFFFPPVLKSWTQERKLFRSDLENGLPEFFFFSLASQGFSQNGLLSWKKSWAMISGFDISSSYKIYLKNYWKGTSKCCSFSDLFLIQYKSLIAWCPSMQIDFSM